MEKCFELQQAKRLINFIDKSPTAFHVIKRTKELLEKNNFQQLDLFSSWKIEKGGRYFVVKNDSALVAFVIGKGEIEEKGFKLIGAHTDSPTFRIKPNPEIVVNDSYLKLNTELYGGPIINTWFDRPLSIAGRVTLKSNDPLNPENILFNLEKPILIIPNLAIHINREVNKGIEIDKQKEVLPLLTMVNKEFEKDNFLIETIAKELGIQPEMIMDFDLFLYEYEKGQIIGLNNEFISSSRLDDLAMVHAGITALINSQTGESTNILALFDNEEIGSGTKQGADSPLLRNILERVILGQGKGREEFLRSLEKSIMISADMAHAVHPNYTEKHDPTNQPLLNNGPVIKINANHRYTTDSETGSIYENICLNTGIPVQKFVNRSDQRGGSTIGPITASQIGIKSLDVGNPLLAMHSIRELGGVKDHCYIIESFKSFFNI